MRICLLKICLFSACLALAVHSFAQTSSSSASANKETERGFTELETFQGTVNSGAQVLKLDSTLGYDFNSHFGMFVGLPVYMAHLSSTTTTVGTTTTTTTGTNHRGIGNAYLGFDFRAPNSTLDYSSALTFGAPTGNTKKGLSTGRATFDWDNRFEHEFSRLTPFFEGGVSNTVPDSRLLTRSFTSLGVVTHLQEGAEFKLFERLGVNGAAYQIVPFGNQKIFSKLVGTGQTSTGTGKKPPVFETAAEVSGNGITRENGFMTWVDFSPASVWDAEIGYTRSMTYGLNGFIFNLQLNVGKMLRSRKSS
jgi:hypothetical protein